MSDGKHDATLDHRRASGAAGNDQPIPPTLGAAPWERFSAPSPDDGAHRWQAEPPVEHQEGDTEKGGCHTDGIVSVADLIAKIGAPTPDRPSHRHMADHRADEVAPDVEPSEVASDVPVDLQDTQVIDTPAYSLEVVSELPDLDATNYPDDPDGRMAAPTPNRAGPLRAGCDRCGSAGPPLPSTRNRSPNPAVGRCCWPRARWRHYSRRWRWP